MQTYYTNLVLLCTWHCISSKTVEPLVSDLLWARFEVQTQQKSDNQRKKVNLWYKKLAYKTNAAIKYIQRKPEIVIMSSIVCCDRDLSVELKFKACTELGHYFRGKIFTFHEVCFPEELDMRGSAFVTCENCNDE